MKSILFVCLGNICRSCAAQGIMQKILKDKNLDKNFIIDSAGLIDYHKGELPDSRMRFHAQKRGYKLDHLSRPITPKDINNFDYIFGMDENNIKGILKLVENPEHKEKITLLSKYCTNFNTSLIPDPYYGNEKDFNYVLDLLEDACNNLCNSLIEN